MNRNELNTLIELDPLVLRPSPYQTRPAVSECLINDLLRSIRIAGQEQACEIYVEDDSYIIFDGHRRVIACAALGRPVLCKIIEPPDVKAAIGVLYRLNTVRRNHQPSAVVMSYLWKRLQDSRRRGVKMTIRRLSQELNIGYEAARQLVRWWRLLTEKDPRLADKAVKERWSLPEIKVALGLPCQREIKGLRGSWGVARPERVVMVKNQDGTLSMQCQMPKNASPELISAYFRSKRWPEPQMAPDGQKAS